MDDGAPEGCEVEADDDAPCAAEGELGNALWGGRSERRMRRRVRSRNDWEGVSGGISKWGSGDPEGGLPCARRGFFEDWRLELGP